MAQNFVKEGDSFKYVVPNATTIEPGDVVISGNLRGVALNGGTEDDEIIVQREGVFNLTKTTGASITQGDALYWDASGKKVTKSTGSSYANKPIGYAFESKESADTEIDVLLDNAMGFDVTLGQLDQGGATNGQVIKWDNTDGTWEAAADLDT